VDRLGETSKTRPIRDEIRDETRAETRAEALRNRQQRAADR
jgi:hypothetical protein